MPHVAVDQTTYDKLAFAASVLNLPVGSLIANLVERSAQTQTANAGNWPVATLAPETPEQERPPHQRAQTTWLPVFKVFKGKRYQGEFNPTTTEVRVDSMPWAGKVFSSPTAAAQAVVEHVSGGGVSPNTNGRKFWHLSDTGKDLRSIIGERY